MRTLRASSCGTSPSRSASHTPITTVAPSRPAQTGRATPDPGVIGVDNSEDRLQRRKPYPEALLPKNMVFVRADLVDYWRLMHDAGLRLAQHYILYPNPWPKIGHLARRWHAHPVFPWIPRLGGRLECRSEERRVGKECRSRWSPYH